MINIQQLDERYPNKSWGFGGNPYFEINSDKKYFLNKFGHHKWIKNENGEIELFDISQRVVGKRHYYSDESWDIEVDYETEHFWDEKDSFKWWGKTLDSYYLWPWYPDKEIIGFTVVRPLPFFDEDEYCEVGEDGIIRSKDDFEVSYWVADCLKYPEFFKPHYK